MNFVTALSMAATLTSVTGYVPSNYDDVNIKPTEVRLLPLVSPLYDEAFVNAQFSTRQSDASYRETFTLLYDYYFIPTKAYCTYDNGTMYVRALDYLMVDFNQINASQRIGVFCFRPVLTGTTARYYEYCYSPETYCRTQFSQHVFTNTIISTSLSGGSDTYGNTYSLTSLDMPSNSDLVFNTFALCSSLAPYVWEQILLLNQNEAYQWAYNYGYTDGYGNEDKGGYHDGYQQGIIAGTDTTPGNIFSDLVSSILEVPLSIFGGLSVFAIFDTPIISVIVSFLLLAIVLLIIKRLL